MSASRIARLTEARRWIGTPFVHGQSRRGAGCDCLGLVVGVWRGTMTEALDAPLYGAEAGDADEAAALQRELGRRLRPVSPAAAAAGDVLLLRLRPAAPARHLGLMGEIGGLLTLIHAQERFGVIETHLGANWRRRVEAAYAWPEETA